MRSIKSNTLSYITHIFAQDSLSTLGAGKTALAFGDITAYYVRSGGTLTQLTMVVISTLGTWDTDVTSNKLGFLKLDDTNAPGLYEIHLPDNILVSGVNTVTLFLKATDTVIAPIMIQLVDEPSLLGKINDASASTTVFITTLTSYDNDFFNKRVLSFVSGNLLGIAIPISDYNTNGTFTVSPALPVAPDNNSYFKVLGYYG